MLTRQASLDEPGSYDRAIAGCDCVIHMASPLMFVKAGQVPKRSGLVLKGLGHSNPDSALSAFSPALAATSLESGYRYPRRDMTGQTARFDDDALAMQT